MAHTRCLGPPFSSRVLHSYGPEECLTIVLTSEIGRGATGVAHRGTLKPEICDSAIPLDVAVKLAFDSEQREALRSEYEVYRHLKSKGVHKGIVTTLGIFDDSEGCACALVLLYAGVPLSESQGNLSISDRQVSSPRLQCSNPFQISNSALSSFRKSIHRAGIDILISDLGVTIIDFGRSQSDDQGAKKKELTRLRCLRSQALENGDASVVKTDFSLFNLFCISALRKPVGHFTIIPCSKLLSGYVLNPPNPFPSQDNQMSSSSSSSVRPPRLIFNHQSAPFRYVMYASQVQYGKRQNVASCPVGRSNNFYEQQFIR
jgi:hypothetical protein